MSTIKVYKTNVKDRSMARRILDEIQDLPSYDPSFDLDDCDKVLRVENPTGVDEIKVRNILHKHGYQMKKLA